jgi:hypothetical protein
MGSDMIVVLGLALAFFGGVGYLAWKERNKKKPQDGDSQSVSQEYGRPIKKLDRKKNSAC